MAEPGDPKGPAGVNDEHDLDDLVGFASPASLAGRAREQEAKASDIVTPVFASEPKREPEPLDEREPDLFDPPEPPPLIPSFDTEAFPPLEPGPFDRTETFGAPLETRFSADRKRQAQEQAQEQTQVEPQAKPYVASPAQAPVAAMRDALTREDRAERRAQTPPAPMSLYAIYVLILLAVPTFGAAALIALLAVTVRRATDDALARSHFVYQKRTLWIATVAAVVGAVLVVFNFGVFVLFLLALWVLARGASGVWKLKDGKPIPNPRTWLF